MIVSVIFLGNCRIFQGDSTNQENRERNQLLLLALATSSNPCPVGNGAFWTIDFRTGGDRCMGVTLKESGESVLIFEENNIRGIRQSNDIPDPNYREILREVEETIIPRLEPMLGSPTDVNRDGKVAIVFANMSTFFTGGSFVAGYFSPLDLFQSAQGLASNQREVIFVDAVVLARLADLSSKRGKANDILSTIAHEYQHLLRFPWEIGRQNSTSLFPLPRTVTELRRILDTDSLWINEGTSELASDVAGFGPQESRLACLRGDPGYGCLNQLNGKSMYRFNNRIIDYSLSYAWMSHIYRNAGTTTQERNEWIRKTIQGDGTGRRGSDISNLIQIYRDNSPRYNASILGNSPESIHGNLTAGFFAGMFRYPQGGDVVSRIGLGAETDVSTSGNNFLTQYPLPTGLNSVFEQPSLVSLINNEPVRFELNPGQIYRVQGSPPTGPEFQPNANVHIIHKKDAPQEYTIFNGSMKEDPTEGFVVVSRNDPNREAHSSSFRAYQSLVEDYGLDRKPILDLPSQDNTAGVHAMDYIYRLNAWKILQILTPPSE